MNSAFSYLSIFRVLMQFERTLIIAEDDSQVSYLEGCTAPSYDSNQVSDPFPALSAHRQNVRLGSWLCTSRDFPAATLNRLLALHCIETTRISRISMTLSCAHSSCDMI
jgi:hypothetical protein